MYFRCLFPGDLLGELERLQRDVPLTVEPGPSILGQKRGYPALFVLFYTNSFEIYSFAPGLDPATLDVQLEKGILTLAGERKPREVPEQATVHIGERFAGRFRRVVSLPDDIDPNSIVAKYRDGVLHVHVQRRQEAQPRRITIQ